MTRPAPAQADAPALQAVALPPRLYVPLGPRAAVAPPPARPFGTAVRRGQPLTDHPAEGFAAPLAPADGRILGVETVGLLDGRQVPAVVLDTTDGAAAVADVPPAAAPGAGPVADLFGEITPSERGTWIEALRLAGVWADRWASPDLLAQLHQSLRRPIDTVLCSVLDADRALPLQSVLADAAGADLAAGVDHVAKLAGSPRAWVLVDAASPAEFQAGIRQVVEPTGARTVPLRNDYPQSNPTLLLYTVLGRRLPPGHLPSEAGVLVLDAAAAVAVGRFVRGREAMLTVPLAVCDAAAGASRYVAAPVGTPVAHVLEQLHVQAGSTALYGGPPPRDVRVTRQAVACGSELSLYATEPPADRSPDPCIRCAWCVEGCPVHIHPAALLEAMQRDDMDLADDSGLHACIDCGVCSYVCPSRLPLLPGIRALRARWAERMSSGR